MGNSIRFIHASDFRLGCPVLPFSEHTGVPARGSLCPDIPPAVTAKLLSATQAAATQVFDAAILRQVDFLLLTGDIFSWDAAGPAGLLFLEAAFQRLADEKIPVYWALPPEAADGRTWWETFILPENVRLLLPGQIHREHFVARTSTEQQPSGVFIFRHPDAAPEKMSSPEIHGREEWTVFLGNVNTFTAVSRMYFAAETSGLRFTRAQTAPGLAATLAHGPGGTQGVSPEVFRGHSSGGALRFGCSLITLPGDFAAPDVEFIPTESVGWKLFRVALPKNCTETHEISELLLQTFKAWAETSDTASHSPADGTLVFWLLSSPYPEHAALLRRIFLENHFPHGLLEDHTDVTSRVLESLRQTLPDNAAFLWHVSLESTLAETGESKGDLNGELKNAESADGVFQDFSRLLTFHRDRLASHNRLSSFEKSRKDETFAGFSPHTLALDDFLTPAQRQDVLRILASPRDGEVLDEILGRAEILGQEMLRRHILPARPSLTSSSHAPASVPPEEEPPG